MERISEGPFAMTRAQPLGITSHNRPSRSVPGSMREQQVHHRSRLFRAAGPAMASSAAGDIQRRLTRIGTCVDISSVGDESRGHAFEQQRSRGM